MWGRGRGKEGYKRVPITGLTPPLFCVCPKQEQDFQRHMSVLFFICNTLFFVPVLIQVLDFQRHNYSFGIFKLFSCRDLFYVQ